MLKSNIADEEQLRDLILKNEEVYSQRQQSRSGSGHDVHASEVARLRYLQQVRRQMHSKNSNNLRKMYSRKGGVQQSCRLEQIRSKLEQVRQSVITPMAPVDS